MQAVKDVEIVLDRQPAEATYHPGAEVTGRVVFRTSVEQYTSLAVVMKGVVKVDFGTVRCPIGTDFCHRDYINGSIRFTRGGYSTRRFYTDPDNRRLKLVIFQQSTSISDQPLPAGEYPFRFTIPSSSNLPSFAGVVGHIRYRVKLQATKAEEARPSTLAKVELPVINLLSVQQPALQAPVSREGEKRTCCLCCASAPIRLSVHLPRSGYLTSEAIVVTATLENTSMRSLRLRATLRETVEYKIEGKQYGISKRLLGSVQSERIAGRTAFQWTSDPLLLSGLLPSVNPPNCPIRIRYLLVVEVVVPLGLNASVRVPIIVCNSP